MVVCRSDFKQGAGRLKPDTLVLILMAAWWVLNLLQAAFTGLADDESYYWYFSQHLDCCRAPLASASSPPSCSRSTCCFSGI